MKKIFTAILLVFLAITGCATTTAVAPQMDNVTFTVIDNRPEEEKVKPNPLSYLSEPIYNFGDDSFSPNRVEYFRLTLADILQSEEQIKFETVTLKKFLFMDYFPVRRRASSNAALASLGVMYSSNTISYQDQFICEIVADVNGETVNASSNHAYKSGALKAFTEQDFSYAARECVSTFAVNLIQILNK